MTFSAEVQRAGELGTSSSYRWSGGRRHRRGWYRWGDVFGTAGGGGLATNCVSCCSCTVRAARVELMLFSETCCLSVSSYRWCCRYPKASAMPWGVSKGNDIWRVDFLEGWVWQGRVIYWMAIHWDSPRLRFKILICCKGDWAQDSRRILNDITDCS